MSRKSTAAEFSGEVYNISVTGRHVTVTEAMKAYAIEKVSKVERFSDRIIDVVITMDVSKLEHRCSIILKVDHTKIKSEGVTTDMYASVDKAVHKLESQLLKYKAKLHDHHTKNISAIDMNVNVLRSASEGEIAELNDDIEEENRRRLLDKYNPHQIVKRETSPLKTLTDGEAMMKLDLSGDEFLIYRCEVSRQIKVIYRREDDNFGVIEVKNS